MEPFNLLTNIFFQTPMPKDRSVVYIFIVLGLICMFQVIYGFSTGKILGRYWRFQYKEIEPTQYWYYMIGFGVLAILGLSAPFWF
jgi:hypothetical protein